MEETNIIHVLVVIHEFMDSSLYTRWILF